MHRILFAFFFSLIFFLGGNAQMPLTKHYSALEYGKSPRNWEVTKSGDGLLYVANSDGILEYDGSQWRFIPAPGNTVRTVQANDAGEVFVGTINNFGFLQKNRWGTREYVSLSDSLKEEDQPQTVWNSACIGDMTYFQTRDKIYVYHNTTLKHIVKSDYYRWSYSDDEHYYALTYDGLFRLEGGELISLPDFGTGYFNSIIFGLERYQEDKLLIFTGEHGPLIYAPNEKSFIPFDENGEVANWCKETRFYGAEKFTLTQERRSEVTSATYFVLISSDAGALVVNEEAEIIYRLNTENGIYSNNINSIYFDEEQKNLWLSTYNGLQKFNFGYPIDKYDFHQNITSRVHAIHKHEGKIYVAADNGLMVKDEQSKMFKQIPGTQSQCWNLRTLDEQLFVAGGNNGLYIVENDELKGQYYTESALFEILPTDDTHEYFLGATYNGVVVFQRQQSGFDVKGIIPNTEGIDCRSMVEDQLGKFWVGTTAHGFLYLELPKKQHTQALLEKTEVTTFELSSGLNSIEHCKVFKTARGLLFTVKNGIYTFDKKHTSFNLYNPFGLDLDADEFNHISLYEDSEGSLWIPQSKCIIDSDNNIDKQSLNMIPVPGTSVFHDENKIAWIGTDDGLFRYGYDIRLPDYTLQTLISKVRLEATDSVMMDGVFIHSAADITLPYNWNAIAFHFTSNEFADEKGVRFRYKLEDVNPNWSEWTTNRFKDYNRLREGEYTFHVQAKDIFGRVGKASSYSFAVAPPWYRTASAYLIYVLGGILLIFTSIRLSIQRLKAAKLRLEKLVRERTHQVVEKNREITDSINYAKRIQSAMLQSEQKSSADLPDHFTLYKPKDIVSGDFYLARQKVFGGEKYWYLVVGDCTGHGVPGGFLTMLGASYLNEMISNDTELMEPATILDRLREKVIKDLGQTGEKDASRDGMDMAIIRLNLDTMEASFAGANNPLWIVTSSGELKEIKGDKQPISYQEHSTPFTSQQVQLNPKDTFYLFSDGFADQFGGENRQAGGKKFKSSNFKKLLLHIRKESMEEQKQALNKAFIDWKGDLEQVDDVCIIGVRV